MEHSEPLFEADAQQPTPSPASIQLAAALAERLNAVVPQPFRVRAEDDRVALYHGDAFDSSIGVAAVLLDRGLKRTQAPPSGTLQLTSANTSKGFALARPSVRTPLCRRARTYASYLGARARA